MMRCLKKFFEKLRGKRVTPKRTIKVYWYRYQRHPFDDQQFFSVRAESQTEANKLAQAKFIEMFERGSTIMPSCFPLKGKPPN